MDTNVSRYQVKDELRKRWTEEAVELALQGNWDEAVQANLRILENYPNEVAAHNRIGRAYAELGRYEEALQAYEDTIKAQPSNNIARKKLIELYGLLKREPPAELGDNIPGLDAIDDEEYDFDDSEDVAEEEEPEPEDEGPEED